MEKGSDSVDVTSRRSLTEAVVDAVADAEGVPPEELAPPQYESLHDVIDPEALDALFAPRTNGTPRPGGNVRFSFCGYVVTVHSDGSVRLE